jgi:transketolase
MAFELKGRRGIYIDIADEMKKEKPPLSENELTSFEDFDRIYRAVCAVMYNYVPMSGHPGGSISSGRFVSALLFDGMDYDLSDPERADADVISYAAGHKALGLYAMWAMRNEVARIAAHALLPKDGGKQLRLEDLLGFRRNPVTDTPLFTSFKAKHLDGHPTPATPFVKLSTGASGVGVTASLGLAFGAADFFGASAPRVHIVEGEGGMTPGRVAEALAAAGTASLRNAVLHVDWNQASIDSNHVCRDEGTPGDYVQWTPAELCFLNDWNVIFVPEGRNFQQIIAAQRKAKELSNSQPTAIVYRTIKGWKYGIEGKASHGAGHKLCSQGFYDALAELTDDPASVLPSCEAGEERCKKPEAMRRVMEECFWETLTFIRKQMEKTASLPHLATRLAAAKERLEKLGRKPRKGAPNVSRIYEIAKKGATAVPEGLRLKPGGQTTLRAALGQALNHYNRESDGAILSAAADLLGSTSTTEIAKGFPEDFYNATSNAGSRLLSIGGICEDAICGVMAGVSTYGHHIGVGSSYGAFIAALGHIAARLHCIGAQARKEYCGEDFKPFFLVCAHAGLKTGEDGPTHADPQCLQLLTQDFPRGALITLTPWDPQEVWPLVAAALEKHPAVIAPFVTRPNERILDRAAMGFAPAVDAAKGVYLLRKPKGQAQGTIVLQGSGVTYAFIDEALPLLDKEGIELNIYYVASAELFDLLPPEEQERVFPEAHQAEAMGITGFTLPTMYRWVRSERGRQATLHPFRKGAYLGSGQAEMVLAEAGLGGKSQFKAIREYVKEKQQTGSK